VVGGLGQETRLKFLSDNLPLVRIADYLGNADRSKKPLPGPEFSRGGSSDPPLKCSDLGPIIVGFSPLSLSPAPRPPRARASHT